MSARFLVPLLAAAFLATPAIAAPKEPRAVVQATIDAINAHDAVALSKLYASDAVLTSSDTCKPQIGPEAVRKGHETLIAMMPDLRLEVTDWAVDGDTVAILMTAHAKALGPTGQMQMSDFLVVRNGLIVRDVTVFNPGQPCS